MRKNGYVYIARDIDGNIKIGGASDVKRRMKQLSSKKKGLIVIAVIRAEWFMYLEKFLHLHLKEHEIVREWYENEKEVIKKVVNFMQGHGEIFGAYEIFFTSPKSQGIT